MKTLTISGLALTCLFFGGSAVSAQSPNTAAIVVSVTDQTGATVPSATVTAVNTQTAARRESATGTDGTTTMPALPLTGPYRISVAKAGFTTESLSDTTLQAGETARFHVRLVATGGHSDVTVYGTTEGIRNDPQLGLRLDSARLDQTPVLGRKITSVPLLNAAFRPAKGTGDLFVNATYFVTGAGGRRQPAVTIDGATNDEPWGRQTMFTTVPMAAVQELAVISNAFSAEFGWTAGAAVNIVTKSGSNDVHGEGLFMARPGGLQRTSLPAGSWCAPSVASCVPPVTGGSVSTLAPADIPDALTQGSFAIGAPLIKDRTHLFAAVDATRQDRTAPVTTPLVAAGTTFLGQYRQALVDGRLDHQIRSGQSLMFRVNVDRFYDTNPQDAVSGNVLPSAGRTFARHTFSVQASDVSVLGNSLLNEARVEFLNGDPITQFEPITPSTQLTRAGSAPFTSGESRYAHIFSRQTQLSDTLSWTRGRHYLRAGGSLAYSRSGGDGTEFGSAFVLGQFTVNANSTKPIDQLTLGDMTRYTQSFNFGDGSYVQNQWLAGVFLQDSYRVRPDLTIDLGARYDRQTFSDGKKNLAPRTGFAWNPGGSAQTTVRGGYGLYFTQLRSNLAANFELGGPLGIFTYTATPGQNGFPASLAGTPVAFDPGAAQNTLPARNITIRPGQRDLYTPLLGPAFSNIPDCGSDGPSGGRPCYPTSLVNPKSQVTSIGIEHEIARGLFVAADYVHQLWTDLDRTVDLNAPSLFVRTAPGQVRSAAAADATRPILPVNGGFRVINVIESFGRANYDGLQTSLTYRGGTRLFASLGYTLSRSTNTTEPDGNGVGPNDQNVLGDAERGPSLLDERHRAVVTITYRLPYNVTAGTVSQFASARPFNATTGVDNNGDGSNTDRPIIGGTVAGRSTFRGTATADVATFVEGDLKMSGRAIRIRLEVFNLFNHANVLGRQGVYGDAASANANFGQALAGLANIEPPRMVQVQIKYTF